MSWKKQPQLRKAARGQACVINTSECTGDDTVVMAHLPYANAGMAIKAPDICGAHLCSFHHAYHHGDGRRDYEFQFIALSRTVARLMRDGVLRVGGGAPALSGENTTSPTTAPRPPNFERRTLLFAPGQRALLYYGDCEGILPHLEPVDAVVTDPPANTFCDGLGWRRIFHGASPPQYLKLHHPSELHLATVERLIDRLEGPILDPFMGSGTVGVACVRQGKSFIGIERDQRYFQAAEARIRSEIASRITAGRAS